MTRSRKALVAVAVLAVSIVALLAHGAPILPVPQKPKDTALSLTKVKQVEIVLERFPRELRDAGITEDSIKAEWTERLTKEHFEVADNKGFPRLVLGAVVAIDPDVPGATSYALIVTFEQPAKLPRIDQDLFVPTYNSTILGLERNDHLGKNAILSVRQCLDLFLETIKMADRSEKTH